MKFYKKNHRYYVNVLPFGLHNAPVSFRFLITSLGLFDMSKTPYVLLT